MHGICTRWEVLHSYSMLQLVSEADVPSLTLALRNFIACNVDPKLPLHIELLVKMGHINQCWVWNDSWDFNGFYGFQMVAMWAPLRVQERSATQLAEAGCIGEQLGGSVDGNVVAGATKPRRCCDLSCWMLVDAWHLSRSRMISLAKVRPTFATWKSTRIGWPGTLMGAVQELCYLCVHSTVLRQDILPCTLKHDPQGPSIKESVHTPYWLCFFRLFVSMWRNGCEQQKAARNRQPLTKSSGPLNFLRCLIWHALL